MLELVKINRRNLRQIKMSQRSNLLRKRRMRPLFRHSWFVHRATSTGDSRIKIFSQTRMPSQHQLSSNTYHRYHLFHCGKTKNKRISRKMDLQTVCLKHSRSTRKSKLRTRQLRKNNSNYS